MPWCATSNIEASHATPITCLQWLPDHIELDRAGLAYENTSQRCVQLLTCATDGGVFVWDLRPEKCVLAVDKTRDQIVVPRDVPMTFNSLDAKWKPLLHVNLFRPDNAPDHCPTCFCIRVSYEPRHNRTLIPYGLYALLIIVGMDWATRWGSTP